MYQKQAADFIASLENCVLQAYPDPKLGWKLPTIGFGTTKYPSGNPVKRGDIISLEQANLYLEFWIREKIEPKVKQIPFWEKMNDNQKTAIISFAYNLGASFYKAKGFTSISNLLDNPKNWNNLEAVKYVFELYCNPHDPKVTKGLKLRRGKEADLFCST